MKAPKYISGRLKYISFSSTNSLPSVKIKPTMQTPKTAEENIKIALPVEVEYGVLNELLKKKLQGKILSKGRKNGSSSDKAKIKELFLKRNLKKGFPVSLQLRIKLLTTLFSGKEVEMLVHLLPEFYPGTQKIFVQKYEIDGLNNGWIINNLLESLVNSFLYNNLKNKMKFNLQRIIRPKIDRLNTKLLSGIEVKNGIFLSGEIKDFKVQNIIFQEDVVIAFLDLSGNNKVHIQKIDF
ncbi:MAG TPA: DUF4403 family protein [Salinimicrobium sp.]|nr:DUF4403 family protein [Salinimicrobium sp.]